ncbi:hypothetical protein DM860_000743 [Cuscuta australis]|uniref:Endonuclease/exonuclease/phosphatase domain-containing protein n=1 Tax=Cuscuta australis TaxID=267555 RepID=A0A328D131_9ASTE|nr:hypothetical protein DM860_000743 [Cuscuta australis]
MLKNIADNMQKAWCVLGDFNAIMGTEDKIGGLPVKGEETKEFCDCIRYCDLDEIPYTGARYTWSNKQGHEKRIYSKLDWAFSNMEWMLRHGTKTLVGEEGISDHSPLILTTIDNKHRSTFKYCEMWSLDPAFNDIVRSH